MYKNYKIDFTAFNLLDEPTENKPQKSDKSNYDKSNFFISETADNSKIEIERFIKE